MTTPAGVDVHQHLWPEPLVDRLRARSQPPNLRGWTLHTPGEPPFQVEPDDHDVPRRVELDHAADIGLACVSLSAPLGIESLPRPEAAALLAAWHEGAGALPEHFRTWVSVPTGLLDPDDLATLTEQLAQDHVVGVQLPATELLSPAAWEQALPVLAAAQTARRAVFMHPGPQPRRSAATEVPGWWPAVVGYVGQLHAAWWGWQAFAGRAVLPTLRLLFAAGAGLAPVHHERHAARGGGSGTIDRDVFVDTSSYGPQGLDALVRVLGIDVLALGSDRPYAAPLERLLGDAATRAIRTTNPLRLLIGDQPRTPQHDQNPPSPTKAQARP